MVIHVSKQLPAIGVAERHIRKHLLAISKIDVYQDARCRYVVDYAVLGVLTSSQAACPENEPRPRNNRRGRFQHISRP